MITHTFILILLAGGCHNKMQRIIDKDGNEFAWGTWGGGFHTTCGLAIDGLETLVASLKGEPEPEPSGPSHDAYGDPIKEASGENIEPEDSGPSGETNLPDVEPMPSGYDEEASGGAAEEASGDVAGDAAGEAVDEASGEAADEASGEEAAGEAAGDTNDKKAETRRRL